MKAERIGLGNSIQACLHVKEAGAKLRLRKASEQQVSGSKESRRYQRKDLPHSAALTRIERDPMDKYVPSTQRTVLSQ